MWVVVWLALAFAPTGHEPVPLLVVLHGDREHARDAAARWRTATDRRLRGYFDNCRAEVVWDLIEGADHGREEAALTARKAGAILDWLAGRPADSSSARERSARLTR